MNKINNIQKNIYFTTGEFAKLCNVTKHTLFHYDESGVFSPDIVAENGYRFYSSQQYDVFSMISELRSLGMSLKDIKIYLDQRSPGGLLDLLTGQRKIIQDQIAHLQNFQISLDEKVSEIQKALQTKSNAIIQETLSENTLLLSSKLSVFDDREFAVRSSELLSECTKHHIWYHTSFGGMRNRSLFESGETENYTHLYVKVIKEGTYTSFFQRPAGSYLVTYHSGTYATLPLSYCRLLAFAKKEHLLLGSLFYEEMILDQLAVFNLEDYVTKLMIEIKS